MMKKFFDESGFDELVLYQSTEEVKKTTILAQGGHCLCVVRQVELGVVFRVFLIKTKRDASQRMADSRSTRWVVRSYSWSASQVGELAQIRAQGFGSSTTRSRRRSSAQAQRSPTFSSPWWQREAHPEEAPLAARARVAKLEAAISAVGESDPTFPALQEALRQARKRAQVQPVESRIKSSEFFIERAKKRVENGRKRWRTLTSEVRALKEGEERHAFLLAEGVFLLRLPMLKSCPHFLRSRLRESFGAALEGVEVVRSCASNVVAPAKMCWFHRAR